MSKRKRKNSGNRTRADTLNLITAIINLIAAVMLLISALK